MRKQLKNLISTIIGAGPYGLPKTSEPLRNPKSDVKANIKPYQHRGKGTRAERRNKYGKEIL